MTLVSNPSRGQTAGRVAMAAQVALIFASSLTALAPPEHGPMLLVPLTSHAAQNIDTLVAQSGAVLTGIGYLPGSRFVQGKRIRLLPQMLRSGVLVVTGSPPLCGKLQGK
ncbi:hypothetical protein [Sphingomonas sp.]|uniref:hypothetical protein n=2 Tax=Sphingomonas TaxID=13687 RepID=UPI002FDB7A8D